MGDVDDSGKADVRALWTIALTLLVVGVRPAPAIDFDQDFFCTARDCLRAYREFVTANAPFARPVEETTLLATLAAVDLAPPPPVLALDREALRAAIVDALNVAFLLPAPPPLAVRVLEEDVEADGTVTRTVGLTDPFVGEFLLREIEPRGRHRLAAVIGLHGHVSSPAEFTRAYLGAELAADGYLVAIPELRAMDCLPPSIGPEADVAWTLLRGGFSLMGLRVYETLVVERYLRERERVDPARIGLLSHSGGSSTANLAVHLDMQIAARVSDYAQDWRNRCQPFGLVHCETVPALFPFGPTIDDEAHQPVPRLLVPYEFADPVSRAAIMDFLEGHLHDFTCVRPATLPACAEATVPPAIVDRATAACRRIRAAEGRGGERARQLLRSARRRFRQAARLVRRDPGIAPPACRAGLEAAFEAAAAQRRRRAPVRDGPPPNKPLQPTGFAGG